MPIINLIQEQRNVEQKQEQGVRMATFAMIVTIAMGVLGYGILLYERQALLAEESRLEQEIEQNKPIVAQIDSCNSQEAALKPRVQTLDAARTVSNKWADILTRLETQTPSGTWLTGLQCPAVSDDKPIDLVFTGTGTAQQPISEFILRAQNQPFLDSVVLHFTQEKRSAGTDKEIDFEMGAEITDSAEVKRASKRIKSHDDF